VPTNFELANLAAIRRALDHHNQTCVVPATAILLNPTDHGLLGWNELWGLSVLPDDRVPVKRVRIECGGSAWGIEDQLDAYLSTEAEAANGGAERP
jgi:hypothetical protein